MSAVHRRVPGGQPDRLCSRSTLARPYICNRSFGAIGVAFHRAEVVRNELEPLFVVEVVGVVQHPRGDVLGLNRWEPMRRIRQGGVRAVGFNRTPTADGRGSRRWPGSYFGSLMTRYGGIFSDPM